MAQHGQRWLFTRSRRVRVRKVKSALPCYYFSGLGLGSVVLPVRFACGIKTSRFFFTAEESTIVTSVRVGPLFPASVFILVSTTHVHASTCSELGGAVKLKFCPPSLDNNATAALKKKTCFTAHIGTKSTQHSGTAKCWRFQLSCW